jgi:hypothetical protein
MKWSAPLARSQYGSRRTCARAARTASPVALPAPSHSSPQKSPTCGSCAAACAAPASAASARASLTTLSRPGAVEPGHTNRRSPPLTLALLHAHHPRQHTKHARALFAAAHKARARLAASCMRRTRARGRRWRAPDLLAPAQRRWRRVLLVARRPAPEPVEQAAQVHRHEEEAGGVRVARAQGAAQEVLVQRHVVCTHVRRVCVLDTRSGRVGQTQVRQRRTQGKLAGRACRSRLEQAGAARSKGGGCEQRGHAQAGAGGVACVTGGAAQSYCWSCQAVGSAWRSTLSSAGSSYTYRKGRRGSPPGSASAARRRRSASLLPRRAAALRDAGTPRQGGSRCVVQRRALHFPATRSQPGESQRRGGPHWQRWCERGRIARLMRLRTCCRKADDSGVAGLHHTASQRGSGTLCGARLGPLPLWPARRCAVCRLAAESSLPGCAAEAPCVCAASATSSAAVAAARRQARPRAHMLSAGAKTQPQHGPPSAWISLPLQGCMAQCVPLMPVSAGCPCCAWSVWPPGPAVRSVRHVHPTRTILSVRGGGQGSPGGPVCRVWWTRRQRSVPEVSRAFVAGTRDFWCDIDFGPRSPRCTLKDGARALVHRSERAPQRMNAAPQNRLQGQPCCSYAPQPAPLLRRAPRCARSARKNIVCALSAPRPDAGRRARQARRTPSSGARGALCLLAGRRAGRRAERRARDRPAAGREPDGAARHQRPAGGAGAAARGVCGKGRRAAAQPGRPGHAGGRAALPVQPVCRRQHHPAAALRRAAPAARPGCPGCRYPRARTLAPRAGRDVAGRAAADSRLCGATARFLQPVLAQAISTLRAPKSSEGYRKIGGGSPLRRITQEQADALEEALRVRGQDARVYVGMRYWYPFMEDAIAQARRRIGLGQARPAARRPRTGLPARLAGTCHGGRGGGRREGCHRRDDGAGCPVTCQRAPSHCEWADVEQQDRHVYLLLESESGMQGHTAAARRRARGPRRSRPTA